MGCLRDRRRCTLQGQVRRHLPQASAAVRLERASRACFQTHLFREGLSYFTTNKQNKQTGLHVHVEGSSQSRISAMRDIAALRAAVRHKQEQQTKYGSSTPAASRSNVDVQVTERCPDSVRGVTPSVPPLPSPFDGCSSVRVEEHDGRGRCAIATAALRAGTPLISSEPYAACLHQAHQSHRCERCLAESADGEALLPCRLRQGCASRYCSASCRDVPALGLNSRTSMCALLLSLLSPLAHQSCVRGSTTAGRPTAHHTGGCAGSSRRITHRSPPAQRANKV